MFKSTAIAAALAAFALAAPLATSASAQTGFAGQLRQVAPAAPLVQVRFGGIGRINARIRRQARRIYAGRRDRSLNRIEARIVRRHLQRIRRLRRIALRDGFVSFRERARLNRQLNRNSRRIRIFRHNRV